MRWDWFVHPSRRPPPPKPAVPIEASDVDPATTWSAVRIGQMLHDLETADMVPGRRREDSFELLRRALRDREPLT